MKRTRHIPGLLVPKIDPSIGTITTLQGLEDWILFWHQMGTAFRKNFPAWIVKYYCLRGLWISDRTVVEAFYYKNVPLYLIKPEKMEILGSLLTSSLNIMEIKADGIKTHDKKGKVHK